MSAGLSLLKAILVSGSPSLIRDINPVMLTAQEELPLYEFVREHLSNFGQLPAIETVLGAGHVLPARIMEGVAYYEREVRKRHAHTAMASRLESFVTPLRANDPDTAFGVLKEMVLAAAPTLTGQRYSSLADQLVRVMADYEYAKTHPGLRGVTLGWPTADELTNGGQGGDLIGIAGRTGMGKTWVMMEMVNAAHLAGYRPLVISMEMTLMQMAYRYVGRVSGINPKLIKQGQLSTYGEEHLRHVAGGLMAPGEVPLYFMAGDMDKRVESVDTLMGDLAPEIVFIDGAYLLTGKAKARGYAAKWEEMGSVMTELKQLFIQRDRPCVMTVQLNRNVTKKSERKFDTTDIGMSDRIPQDMSVLWGVRAGQAPFTTNRRVMDWIKNREDEARDFAVRYQFSPVSFEEVPLEPEAVASSAAGAAGNQPAQVSVNWME